MEDSILYLMLLTGAPDASEMPPNNWNPAQSVTASDPSLRKTPPKS